MANPLCSIIIPTYNHGKYIERCIQSALNQTYKNIEIIVIDDGSTDDTASRVISFRERVKYVYKENGGQGSARNKGIEVSRGKYVQFIDADDRLFENKIESQITHLEERENTALVYSDCTSNDPDGQDTGNISYRLTEGEDPLRVLIFQVLSNINACLIRRSAVVAVGMFDENRFSQEDWDFWLKLALSGHKFKYIPGNFSHYDQKGSGTITDSILMYKRTKHLLDKYLGDPQFLGLDDSLVNDFTASQNFSLATRSYNNGWWQRSRGHFLKAIRANPELVERKYWMCIPKAFLHQIADAFTGRRSVESESLDQ